MSDINTRYFSLDEVVRTALERRLADVHVALPGSIVSYSSLTQTATVRPLLKGVAPDPSGLDVAVTLPDIYSVPVVFAGGGGARATFPVAAGDMALLVFSDRALDRWKSFGAGTPAAALDSQANNQHALADAVAIVGLQAPGLPWLTAPTDRATFGYDVGFSRVEVLQARINLGAGASQALVLGGQYQSHMTSLQTALSNLSTALNALGQAITPLMLPPAAAAAKAAAALAVTAATAASSAASNLAADISSNSFTT